MKNLWCRMFGHEYPMFTMFSCVMYGFMGGDSRDIDRKRCTCSRCGYFDEARYQDERKEHDAILAACESYRSYCLEHEYD